MVRFKKVVIYLVLFSFFISGCGQSYPKEKVAQHVVDLCKKEYGIDVIARVQGKTDAAIGKAGACPGNPPRRAGFWGE